MATKRTVKLDAGRFGVDASVTPIVGKVRFKATRRVGVAGSVVLPADVLGVLGGAVELPVTSADYGFMVDLIGVVDGAPITASWCVTVPDGVGEIALSSLTEVDRKTFNQVAPPAWTAQLQALIDALVSKQDEATLSQDLADRLADPDDPFTVADSANIATAISGKANTSDVYSKTASDARYATTAQGVKADSAVQPAALSSGLAGKADLVGGVVPTSQIPGVALTTGQAVANRAAMLALSNIQEGDIVSITGTSDKGTYLLGSGSPSVFASWLPLSTPTDVVTTVNGQQGTVVLGAADVGAPPTSRTVAGKPLSADVTLAKSDVGLGNVDNTADSAKPVSTPQQTVLDGKSPGPTMRIYDTPGSFTWAKPAGLRFVEVICIAAGSGGGSGRRGLNTSDRFGGGGGAGGQIVRGMIPASTLAATEPVQVPAGGAGGASVTADGTDGAAGTSGSPAFFSTTTASPGRGLAARGGGGGGGGTATTGAGGSGASSNSGGPSSVSGGGGNGNSPVNLTGAPSGGGGGGISAGNLARVGGLGGFSTPLDSGIAGTPVGVAGKFAASGNPMPGYGGGGGSAANSTAGMAGGDGGNYGAGGGGGAASENGFASGKGGNGGQGIVIVVEHY